MKKGILLIALVVFLLVVSLYLFLGNSRKITEDIINENTVINPETVLANKGIKVIYQQEENTNGNSTSTFNFTKINADMLNSGIKIPILLPQKIDFAVNGEKIQAEYTVTEDVGYRVNVSTLVPENGNCNGAEFCTVAYFEGKKNTAKDIGGFGWEKIKINENLDAYYFNESSRTTPTLEFIYNGNLYTFQIKNKSKVEVLSYVRNILDDSFTYKLRDSYYHARDVLKQNGWLAIIPSVYENESGTIPSTTTPIDTEFPEISYCGSGVNAICTVDFRKGLFINHLDLQHSESNEAWFVVGSE
ncbi:MAG: hypothetical protein WCQ00_03895 [bacterium]